MFSVLLIPALTASEAEAKGSKQRLTQDYQVNEPLHGFSGRQGDYYCDYIRIPNRVCAITSGGTEKCKVKGWTLRQTCY
ncbi:MAG: hypothetical protein K0U34_04595 [Alphaproteobacteria bacterium]|nr:hypothetical protein [Alphaproteobacteria bacterium]